MSDQPISETGLQELCVVCGKRPADAGTCGPCERDINTPHDPRAGLLEDVAERLGLPRPADERVVAAVVELIDRVATLEGGILKHFRASERKHLPWADHDEVLWDLVPNIDLLDASHDQ